MTFKILHLNIELSKHNDAVVKLLEDKKPDIVCFIESMEKDVEHFASHFGYNYVHSPRFILDEGNKKDKEGVAILSKYKMLDIQKHTYGDGIPGELPIKDLNDSKVDDPRPAGRFFDNYTFLTSLIDLGDKKITVSTTHFPVTDYNGRGMADHELKDIKNIDDLEHSELFIEKIISFIRDIKGPTIFTADLNSPRGKYFYDTIAHELVDQVPASLKSSIDPVLHRAKNLKLVVDAFMTTPDFNVESFEIIEGVSDHKAYFVTLNL